LPFRPSKRSGFGFSLYSVVKVQLLFSFIIEQKHIKLNVRKQLHPPPPRSQESKMNNQTKIKNFLMGLSILELVTKKTKRSLEMQM